MTALVKTPEGPMTSVTNEYYRNRRHFAEDLQRKGYRVIHIWNFSRSNDEAREWAKEHMPERIFQNTKYR